MRSFRWLRTKKASSAASDAGNSAAFTLTAMSYVSLLVPFVIAYMWYAWWSMNRKKMNREELTSEDHLY